MEDQLNWKNNIVNKINMLSLLLYLFNDHYFEFALTLCIKSILSELECEHESFIQLMSVR